MSPATDKQVSQGILLHSKRKKTHNHAVVKELRETENRERKMRFLDDKSKKRKIMIILMISQVDNEHDQERKKNKEKNVINKKKLK